MWRHKRRNQIWSSSETDESIYIGGGVSRVLAFLECGSAENNCSNTEWTVPSQAEDCWLPTPFASFPFTSPPVLRRVPPDSVSTLPLFYCNMFSSCMTFTGEFAFNKFPVWNKMFLFDHTILIVVSISEPFYRQTDRQTEHQVKPQLGRELSWCSHI